MPESKERGALTEAVTYILLSLYTPLHGYGIMRKIKEMSAGRVNVGPGTLYGAINTLISKGWIEECEDEANAVGKPKDRKKPYVITHAGKCAVEAEVERLEGLITNCRRIIEENKLTVADTQQTGIK